MGTAIELISPYVRAVVGSPKDRVIEFIGSAFLYRKEEKTFLISAAHVIDWCADDYPLFIDRPNEGLVRIYGEVISSESNALNRKDDKLDFAILQLRDEIAEKLINTPMLKYHHLDLHNECDYSKGFIVAGFPVSKNKQNIYGTDKTAQLYGLHSVEAAEDVYNLLGINKSDHLAIHLNKKAVFSDQQQKRNAVGLIGLSGSPVWGMTKEGKGKVVSMLTEHHQKNIKAILTLRVNVVINTLTIASS